MSLYWLKKVNVHYVCMKWLSISITIATILNIIYKMGFSRLLLTRAKLYRYIPEHVVALQKRSCKPKMPEHFRFRC